MTVCVQDVAGKKKFLVKFEDDQNKYMSCVFILYVCLKEEVCLDTDEPPSNYHKK